MTTWDKVKDNLLLVAIVANIALNLIQGDINAFAAWIVCFLLWIGKMDAIAKLEEWQEEGKVG